MSNQVTLQGTEFHNHPNPGKTFGWRLYDDHDCLYNNCMATACDDDLELLQHAMEFGDLRAAEMLDFVMEHEKDITINGEVYTWEQIKHLWGEDTS